MDSWEDEDSVKPAPKTLTLRESQWEGEDEDDDVIDSWDQPEPEPELEQPPEPAPVAQKKGKKKQKTAIEEEREEERELTAEEKAAEKLRRQKLQEESDLGLARDMFGVTPLDTKEEFDRFKDEIDRRLADATRNANYTQFAEDLVQAICLNMSSTDIKRIHNMVGNLHIEKLKLEKGDKGKKKYKIKTKLKVDDETDYNDYSGYSEDLKDFI